MSQIIFLLSGWPPIASGSDNDCIHAAVVVSIPKRPTHETVLDSHASSSTRFQIAMKAFLTTNATPPGRVLHAFVEASNSHTTLHRPCYSRCCQLWIYIEDIPGFGQLERCLSLMVTRKVRICIGCSVTCAVEFGSVATPPVSVVSCISCASPSHAANQAGRSTVAYCFGQLPVHPHQQARATEQCDYILCH